MEIFEGKRPERIRHDVVHAGRFDVVIDELGDGGVNYPYSFVDINSGSMVLPFIDDDHILAIWQYRHPIAAYVRKEETEHRSFWRHETETKRHLLAAESYG